MRNRLFCIMLSLALVLGLSLTALAWDGNPYAGLVGTTTEVTFNGKPWYIIEDDSTAENAGAVTLLAADTGFGLSAFDAEGISNQYEGSTVKSALEA